MKVRKALQMYKLSQPTMKIDDYFDELLLNRRGAAGQYRLGRLKAIKQALIKSETTYSALFENGRENALYQIKPVEKIPIPKETLILDFFHFSPSQKKKKLIETLRKHGLQKFIDEKQTKDNILNSLESIRLEDIDWSTAESYEYMQYVDKQVMKDAYENYVVEDIKKHSDGVYDKLMALAADGKCAYCLVGNAKTLDHYLPKSLYIDYAITSINLIPCCRDCNDNKGAEQYCEDTLFIHSYFEDIEKIDWLFAEVAEDFPITFNFKINPETDDTILRTRLEYQFEKLELGITYGRDMGIFFNTQVRNILSDYKKGGLDIVREALEENRKSTEYEPLRVMQAKMYEALLNSHWFMSNETMKAMLDFYQSE